MGLGLVASRACCAATLLTCRSGGYQQGGPGRAQEHYHKPQAAGGPRRAWVDPAAAQPLFRDDRALGGPRCAAGFAIGHN